MKLLIASRDKINILCGKVTEVKADGEAMVVVLEGTRYDKSQKKNVPATANIKFYNSSDADDIMNGKKQYASRIKSSKLAEHIGSVIMVSTFIEGKEFIGTTFKYSGVITLPKDTNALGEEQKELNIILGNAVNVQVRTAKTGNRFLSLGVPLPNGQNGTVFHNISIFNGKGKEDKLDAKASLLAQKEENGVKTTKKVLFVCGENSHFNNGNSYINLRFEVAEEFKKEITPAESKAETATEDFMEVPDEEELPWN